MNFMIHTASLGVHGPDEIEVAATLHCLLYISRGLTRVWSNDAGKQVGFLWNRELSVLIAEDITWTMDGVPIPLIPEQHRPVQLLFCNPIQLNGLRRFYPKYIRRWTRLQYAQDDVLGVLSPLNAYTSRSMKRTTYEDDERLSA
jgi:hypothetical protein